jgi:TPR repeat protein
LHLSTLWILLPLLAMRNTRTRTYKGSLFKSVGLDKSEMTGHMLAAEQGAMEAQRTLGQIYESGQGVAINSKEAVAWYRRSADQGDAESAGRLGRIFLLGQGVDKNTDEAVKFLTLAAEKGNAYAQFNLAGLYVSGTGVKRDLRKAYSLFALAGKTLDVTQQLKEVSSQLAREDSASPPSGPRE